MYDGPIYFRHRWFVFLEETSVKQFLLAVWLGVLLLAGYGFSQSEPVRSTPDALDRAVSDLQQQIDEKGYHWTAGRTTTAEMSDEEFRRMLMPYPPKDFGRPTSGPKLMAKAGRAYPAYFDWRDSSIVTSVKNQGSCGSCWAFAATGAFEAAIKKHDHIDYDLSERQVMSCNIYESGCGGGWAESAYELFQRYGAVLETCMPYQPYDGVPCTQGNCQVVAKLKGWTNVDNDVNAIKEAILTGPVYISYAVYSDFRLYSSGCYEHLSGSLEGWHAVVAVGWDDNACGTGQGAWICKNSWGAGWASLGGYFFIKWGTAYIGSSTCLPLYPPDPVTLTYDDNLARAITGGDNTLDPGDTATLRIQIANSGLTTATAVAATLYTVTPGITIIDNQATFPEIPFGETDTTDSPHFMFAIGSGVTAGTQVDFTLHIACDQGTFIQSCSVLIGDFQPVYTDDMEGSRGWTHAGTLDDWVRGAPTGGCPTDPIAAHSPLSVWGNNIAGTYAPNAANYLESPTIDCSSITHARLRFWRLLSVEKGIYDNARIYVNGNLAWENNPDYDIIDTEWRYQDVDISSWADGNAAVKIRFSLNSDGGLQLGGWNIDDLAIAGLASYIPGDANGDGVINVGDAVHIINYVFKGGVEPSPFDAGDANCDTVINVGDAVHIINYVFKGGQVPGCP